MQYRAITLFAVSIAIAAATVQASSQAPAPTPNSDANAPAQGQGQRGRWGSGGVGTMGEGRGVMGTVTAIAADHFTVKNEAGESWAVHFSANTRVMKQAPRPARSGATGDGTEQGSGQGAGQGAGRGMGGNPPTPIKATDIKVGDAIMAAGEVDQNGKSVGAVMVIQLDPGTAKRMEEMRANFGKTWIMGKVTAINETTVTVQSGVDNAAHTFVADENTSFRKRRDPITLGDIQVGDNVRVEGAMKGAQFVAASVSVMAPQPNGGPARRTGPPPQ